MKIIVLAFLSLNLLINDCASQKPLQTVENTNSQTITTSPKVEGDYQTKLKTIETERLKLAKEYQQAADKKDSLEKARQTFVSSIETEIFPYWYGTDWDFYGTTQTPKTGKIACGYFVTTVLRDAGLKVQRVSLAQQASENIVKSLTDKTHILRFRNVPIEKFVGEIKNFGAGIYVVGLDNHVGFILNDGAEMFFIHSSYVEPSEVIRERAVASPILGTSKYRVVGNISGDAQLIKKWLDQTAIPTLR